MNKPAKWIEYGDGSGRPIEINPAYVEYLESFAKRAANEMVSGKWISYGISSAHCRFCLITATEPHSSDCIVLASQEYLKDNE